jgi:anti-sigma-K factor RskA
MNDHERHHDEVGAYLLGALNDLEHQAFERHLRGCAECQEEVERLRPAAEALPGSVVQLDPPPGLRKRLMAEVERDAAAAGRAERARAGWLRALRLPRPALVAATLLLGLAIGFGVAQLGGDETRTVTATVAKLTPDAGGKLEIEGDRATLQLHNMPDLGRARVYEVWFKRGDRLVPTRTFEVGPNGRGDVRLPDVGDADAVYVTREARGGAQVPSEDPIVSVPL